MFHTTMNTVVEKQRNKFYIFEALIYENRAIGLISWMFANGPGVRESIPVRVIAKTQKIVLDTTLALSIIRWGSRSK